jgi:glycosyltransferase involved in cell wall biosynthesis
VGAAHAFVVPVFGRPQWLPQLLDSLQRQTCPSPILIATSTPTPELTAIAARHGVDVRVNPAARGIAADWNFALAQTSADWVTLAHQDDWYAPSYVERCLDAAARARAPRLVFTSARERHEGPSSGGGAAHHVIKRALCEMAFWGAPAIASPWRKRLLLSFGDPIPCPSVMIHRAAMPDFRFPDGWRTALDWVAWLDVAQRPGAFVYVRDPLVEWRVHPSSATHAEAGARAVEDRRVLERLWPSVVASVIDRAYAAGRRRYTAHARHAR